MYKFFFNISWRSLTKRGVFPIINIIGLSIGLAVVLLICLLIYNEQSFDKSFKKSDNIYRINSGLTAWMPGETFCTTGNAVGPAMKENIPEILATVRVCPVSFTVTLEDKMFRIKQLFWVDPDFFRLFDTPFLQGTPEDALSRPNTVAISEKMAGRMFGNKNPMGETFKLNNQVTMEVAAVYKDYPENTSFADYQIVGAFQYSYPAWLHEQISWNSIDFETFCLLHETANPETVDIRLQDIHKKYDENGFYVPRLQRLDEIHLNSARYHQTYTYMPSDITKVRMLALLAVIILLVACINYMNLSTARAQKRSKEIGISKTLGAKRRELVIRLFTETGLFTLISFVLAFILAYALLPVFNNILGEQLHFGLILSTGFSLRALIILAATTVIAATYPAVYLSGFPPLKAIRQGILTGRSSHAIIRKVLTVGQFSVTIVLIAWVIVIQTQIKYVNNKDIGYNPHHLIGISLGSLPENSDFEALENDYRSQSSILMTARSQAFPFGLGYGESLYRNEEDKNGISMWTNSVDEYFTDLMEMKLIAGKTLPKRVPGDTIIQVILNRKAVEYLETTPDELIGKKLHAHLNSNSPTYVCGVVENFNFESLYRPIGAYGINNGTRFNNFLIFKHKGDNISEQLKAYEHIFKKHFPNNLFEVRFPDLELEKAYEGEQRTNRVAVCFSILAILVACMGVFGLTAFMAEQRTKEIGIRKVMGASIGNVVSLFTNSYVRLLLISLAIAIPVAWWVSNLYLQDFAYRISPAWWIFVVAAIITAALTLLTVSFQAIKAATANPVKSLKSE